MSGKNWMLLIAFAIVFVLACCAVLYVRYLFESWVDPKEAAVEKVKQCLTAEGDEQQETCDRLIHYPCWDTIIQSVDDPNPPHSVDILWYNWEDHIPNRGGDEVFLQVTFADGNIVNILYYEGWLEYCEYPRQ